MLIHDLKTEDLLHNLTSDQLALMFTPDLNGIYKDIVFVRAGYSDIKQYTIGAGVKLPKLNIDYSFARFSASELDRLPDSHRISLILTLEEPRFMRDGI